MQKKRVSKQKNNYDTVIPKTNDASYVIGNGVLDTFQSFKDMFLLNPQQVVSM